MKQLARVLFAAVAALTLGGWSASDASAVTVYFEDFNAQLGKGAAGAGTGSNPPVIDVAGVDWSIDVSGGNFTGDAVGDHFRVEDVGGNLMFEARDPGGVVLWFTPVIDISGLDNVAISLVVDAQVNGGQEFSAANNDIFRVLYSVDGGAVVLFWDAEVQGPWPAGNNVDLPSNETISSGIIPSGNSLQVQVFIDSRSGIKFLRFDDVTVTGDPRAQAQIPEPATGLLALMAGAAVLRRRKRVSQ